MLPVGHVGEKGGMAKRAPPVNEKRRPHYILTEIKAAFADPTTLNRAHSAIEGAEALGLGAAQVVAVIQGLNLGDFDKSMTSLKDRHIWQDVYKPNVVIDEQTTRRLYVKFTLDAKDAPFLISFKESDNA
jgi:motility quorum-sensing regulator / GCU-specific mRNA interferase toxin